MFFFLAAGNMAVMSPNAGEVYIPSQNVMALLKLFFVLFCFPQNFWKISIKNKKESDYH